MRSAKFFQHTFSLVNFDNFVSLKFLFIIGWLIYRSSVPENFIAHSCVSLSREWFFSGCYRNSLKKSVFIREWRSLRQQNFMASWLMSACFRLIYLFDLYQHVQHSAIDYILKKVYATAQQWRTDNSVSAFAGKLPRPLSRSADSSWTAWCLSSKRFCRALFFRLRFPCVNLTILCHWDLSTK